MIVMIVAVCLIVFFFAQLLDHRNCKKFQNFLLDEFGRLFKMFIELGKKESDSNDKLICALEKCDKLQSENEQLEKELDDFKCLYFDF